jgi:hypothetical protein
MDYSYFNAAPEDQRIAGYFAGDEPLRLENMHPTLPLIHSRLPGLRLRCFATQIRQVKGAKPEVLVHDLKTNLDTVWLFPHLMRGLVIYRGVIQTADDEADDIIRLYLATEALDDPPGDLNYYLKRKRKNWPPADRS